MSTRTRLIVAVLAFLPLAGCGSKGPYGLAPVSGVVTFDGQPAAGARVVFQPRGTESTSNKSLGPGSYGKCDDQGHYELMTLHDEPGAVVGNHRVVVNGPRTGDAPEPYPARYNGSTELSFDVPADGTDQANFELTSAP